MAKRVTVTTELTTEELHERYRSATNAVERTHWHMLWLIKEGRTPDEVAFMLGYTARWVRTIVQRWNRAGKQAIRDQRRLQKGAPPLLSPEQQQELDQALDQPPADGGLWNGPKVAAGTTCSGWGEAPACHAHSMRRATQLRNRHLKKTPRRGREAAPDVPRSQD